jgi:hypothetical protein
MNNSIEDVRAYTEFCRKHERALRSLRSYAADDAIDRERLCVLLASRSVADMATEWRTVELYAANSIAVSDLADELKEIASK